MEYTSSWWLLSLLYAWNNTGIFLIFCCCYYFQNSTSKHYIVLIYFIACFTLFSSLFINSSFYSSYEKKSSIWFVEWTYFSWSIFSFWKVIIVNCPCVYNICLFLSYLLIIKSYFYFCIIQVVIPWSTIESISINSTKNSTGFSTLNSAVPLFSSFLFIKFTLIWRLLIFNKMVSLCTLYWHIIYVHVEWKG